MMTLIISLLGSFARRWFGGAFKSGIMSNRGLQTAFMLGLFMSIYVTNNIWQCWLLAAIVSCWLQFQFWSRGHGCCFDLGRNEEPSESTIKRYNERWYHIPCDWLLSKHKYGFLYDFIYMGLRYTFPMIPMMIFDWRYVLVGLSISPIYAFCWTLNDRENWLFKNRPEWINSPTKLAEIISGALVYGSCYLICWG